MLIRNTVFLVDLVDSTFHYADEGKKFSEIIEKKIWLALQSALLDADKNQDPLFLKVNVNLEDGVAKAYCVKKILKCPNSKDERKKTVGTDYIVGFITVLDYDAEDNIYNTLNISDKTAPEALAKLKSIEKTISDIAPTISSKDLKSTMLRFILGKGD